MIEPMPEVLTVTRHEEVCAILANRCFVVPPAGPARVLGTLAWLQSSVSRFCSGPDHDRRRAAVVAALHRMSLASLPSAAGRRALAVLASASGGAMDLMARLARPVPIAVLGSVLGVAEDDLPVLVECVGVVAAAYFPGISAEQQARADSAVARLVPLLGVDPDEATANRIGLLVQACEATAGLIANALRLALQLPPSCAGGWPVEALVNETLRYDSPIRNTRRHALPGAASNGRPLDAGTGVLTSTPPTVTPPCSTIRTASIPGVVQGATCPSGTACGLARAPTTRWHWPAA
jgi:cytochrome P450